MRESDADGDQDLHLWARELEDVCREIMEDPVFKGNQNFKFEMDLDEAGKRLFGGEANAGVAFQIGQLRYVQCLFVYVHDNIQDIHASLSFTYGHAHSPIDTIENFGISLASTCTYFVCQSMYCVYTCLYSMYIVYPYDMVCCAGHDQAISW